MFLLTHRYTAFFLATVGVLFLAKTNAIAVTTSYHIGNSLTHDSQPLGIEAIAASRGLEHEVGYHIRGSSSIQNILDNPEDVSLAPNEYGTFTTALPNNAWDIVTIQPHLSSDPLTTLGQDLAGITTLINLTRQNPANANTNFYIYQGWPQPGGTLYQNRWNFPSVDNLNTKMSASREYYNNLIERVRDETGANVYMVPMGEILFELDVRMKAGKIPGFTTITQLFRDGLHLAYGRGQFVAGVTTFATTLGQYPTELEMPAFYEGQAFTDAQRTIILDTIREVIDQHPYSGVRMPAPLRTDFDRNNIVDQLDLQLLLPSLNVEEPYDFDLDGDVDGRDFLVWQRNYHSQLSPSELAAFERVDLNGDGELTDTDIQVWQSAYGANNNADLDGDGDTDGRDYLMWQRSYPGSPGDIDRDFLIGGIELDAWQESFGFNILVDANGDGLVNTADYNIWQEEEGLTWNFPYALSAPPLPSQNSGLHAVIVPEPDCAVLSVLCFILYTFRPQQPPLSVVRAHN